MNISNPLIYAAPAFIGFILLELSVNHVFGDKKLYNWKDFSASFFLGVGTLVLSTVLKLAIISFIFSSVYEYFNPLVDGVRRNILGYQSFGYAWYIFLCCQFLDDFSFYWYHRLSHTVRVFWAAHLPHHSSDYFNYGTGVRIGWFVILYKPLFYLWIVALGFHYEILMVCMGIETIYQFILHTKYVPKLGVLEKIIVTPAQHRVHHSRCIPHLDKNHGGILSIFDRLFGTYYEENKETKPEFGILHPPDTYNPFVLLTHEFKAIWLDVKKARSFHEILMYIFGPPGWSPDGSRKTAKEMQYEYSQKHP